MVLFDEGDKFLKFRYVKYRNREQRIKYSFLFFKDFQDLKNIFGVIVNQSNKMEEINKQKDFSSGIDWVLKSSLFIIMKVI